MIEPPSAINYCLEAGKYMLSRPGLERFALVVVLGNIIYKISVNRSLKTHTTYI